MPSVKNHKLLIWASLLLAVCLQASSVLGEEDIHRLEPETIVEELKQMDIFSIRSGSSACPLPMVGQPCPEGNSLYYFKCCNSVSTRCCFHPQDWVVAILLVVLVICALWVVIKVVQCICCCRV